tara:strand:+ start:948 stop:1628 length:681 start_codon:yes stop_codon:yes gene_type:complete
VNYYQHHIGDFNNSTRHLTRLERSVYRDLLDLYYETEMPLQCDRIALARRALVKGIDEHTAMDVVLDEFFTLEADGYHHERCEKELALVYQKSDRARASAEKRWEKYRNKTDNNANAMRTQCDRNATQHPIPSNNTTTTTTRPTVDQVAEYIKTRSTKINPQSFVDYYSANGWKVGRNAMKDWKAAVRTWEKNENERNKPTGSFTQNSKGSGSVADNLRAKLVGMQ